MIRAHKGSGLHPDYTATSAVLKNMGIPKDFESNGPLRYTHRRTANEDIYFVANRSDKPVNAMFRFRVKNGSPVLMDPVTGTSLKLPDFSHKGKITSVPMMF